MKRVIEVKFKITLEMEEGQDVAEVVNELSYDFADTTGVAEIVETELLDYEITDSK